jgi:hypothetical protein
LGAELEHGQIPCAAVTNCVILTQNSLKIQALCQKYTASIALDGYQYKLTHKRCRNNEKADKNC